MTEAYGKKHENVSSFDVFDKKTGKKISTVNHVLYKSVDEYDIKSGKKLRTVNFSTKDDRKIKSIQYYDLDTGKIKAVALYRRDGKTRAIIKQLDNSTGKIIACNDKQDTAQIPAISSQTSVKSIDNIKFEHKEISYNISDLLDRLFNTDVGISSH